MPTMSDPTDPPDPFDLQRFVSAQERVYATVLAELRSGRKQSHWMWYIFPQIDGLGYSSTSKRYAIKSLSEARAYLQHPLLGSRLVECAAIVLQLTGRSASAIFGAPDDMKLRSSMTLFAAVPDADPVFAQVLEKYFAGQPDRATLDLLAKLEA
ncbi:MAG TPA: DUF1810 domain-containing protein [Herpetosiphonaceae bacterium]